MTVLSKVPRNLRDQSGFTDTEKIVRDIYAHPALRFEQDSLTHMIESSLLFTVCFYRNLRSVLFHTVAELAIGMEYDTERLSLVMRLCSGELTDRVRSLDEGLSVYGPHYVWMFRAARAAGISTEPIERFVYLLNDGQVCSEACHAVGFNQAVTEYLDFSTECCKSYHASLATIAGREHVLAETFEIMVGSLPSGGHLDQYREFLAAHVVADRDKPVDPHADLMTRLVELQSPEDMGQMVVVMYEFFKRRKAVYDTCLTVGGLYL